MSDTQQIGSADFFADYPQAQPSGGDDTGDSLDDALAAALDGPEDDPEPDADAEDSEPAEEDGDSTESPPAPDPDAPPSEPELPAAVQDELDALRRERDQVLQAQQAQQAQESERYWSTEWQRIQQEYAGYQRWIRDNAGKAYDQAAFLETQHANLATWWAGETGKFQQQREQALWQAQARERLPAYASAVARHWGLPEDDVPRLLRVADPNEMNALAESLREVRQMQRQATAEKLAAGTPAPGTGKAAPRRRPKNIDQYLDQVFA